MGCTFLMDQVVMVESVAETGDRVSVSTLVPWTVPLGWEFTTSPDDLVVIHHVDPPSHEDRFGNCFNPKWLEKIRDGIKVAIEKFQAQGGLIPT